MKKLLAVAALALAAHGAMASEVFNFTLTETAYSCEAFQYSDAGSGPLIPIPCSFGPHEPVVASGSITFASAGTPADGVHSYYGDYVEHAFTLDTNRLGIYPVLAGFNVDAYFDSNKLTSLEGKIEEYDSLIANVAFTGSTYTYFAWFLNDPTYEAFVNASGTVTFDAPIDTSPVPEPATYALTLLGLGVLAVGRWRKR